MNYEKPQIVDYGDLLTLTASQGSIGTEDGAAGQKTIQAGVGGVAGVSVGVF